MTSGKKKEKRKEKREEKKKKKRKRKKEKKRKKMHVSARARVHIMIFFSIKGAEKCSPVTVAATFVPADRCPKGGHDSGPPLHPF